MIGTTKEEEKPAPLPGVVMGDEKPAATLVKADEKVKDAIVNATSIFCRYCKSKILPPSKGVLTEKEIWLQPDKTKKPEEGEKRRWFWAVKDKFDFYNIAFSKDVSPELKYLTCADCERGLVGVHYLKDGTSYVCVSTVRYL
eukprot:TRINITY_DN141899_c0_g1_i1.p1 TRINITY_DN141899_c0_g1~~TRINITY_DN141899_c0_g1_i1.p1  ORF type:complete len:142 (-),score=13.38 TRINITY_DN141899_c0_g1_i1:65-490(-)